MALTVKTGQTRLFRPRFTPGAFGFLTFTQWRGRSGLGPARSIVMHEVVIALLAAFLIGIMVAALVVHFLL